MMKDGKYHAELKHRQEAEKAEVLAQEFGDRIRKNSIELCLLSTT